MKCGIEKFKNFWIFVENVKMDLKLTHKCNTLIYVVNWDLTRLEYLGGCERGAEVQISYSEKFIAAD